jgi:hypothetical protein
MEDQEDLKKIDILKDNILYWFMVIWLKDILWILLSFFNDELSVS